MNSKKGGNLKQVRNSCFESKLDKKTLIENIETLPTHTQLNDIYLH